MNSAYIFPALMTHAIQHSAVMGLSDFVLSLWFITNSVDTEQDTKFYIIIKAAPAARVEIGGQRRYEIPYVLCQQRFRGSCKL